MRFKQTVSGVRSASVLGFAAIVALGLGPALRGQEPINLGDIVAGGDGRGTAPAENVGVHADLGTFQTANQNGTITNTGDNPQAVLDSDFIDSVFIIDRPSMPINTDGVTFDFAPADFTSNTWNHILKDHTHDIDKPILEIWAGGRSDWQTCVGIHSSAGVTFDLDELRAEHGEDNVGIFRAFFGSDQCGSLNINLYAVLSDPVGVLDFRQVGPLGPNQGQPVTMLILPEATYLTLITAASNGSNGCDHGVFADAVILPLPPVLITRTFPPLFTPGSAQDIILDVMVIKNVPDLTITEPLPLFWEAANPTPPGTIKLEGSHQTVEFNFGALTAGTNSTLTYTTLLPDPFANAIFRGKGISGGQDIEIFGDTNVTGGSDGLVRDALVTHFRQPTSGCAGAAPGAAALRADHLTDGAAVTEQTVIPAEGEVLNPDFDGAARSVGPVAGNTAWELINAATGLFDLNTCDECMSYLAHYVIVPGGSPVSLRAAASSDDSQQILIDGQEVWLNNIPRGAALPPQDHSPVFTLDSGKHLVLHKIFDGCGGHGGAFRFEDENGDPVAMVTTTDPTGYVPPAKIFRITRDIPDLLSNGQTGTVTLSVLPLVGAGVVVINEELPPGLTPSAPSAGGVLNGQKIAWNLGMVTSPVEVSYSMAVGDTVFTSPAIPGAATLDGQPLAIVGDTSFTGASFNPQGFIKLWDHLGPLAWAFPSVAGDNGVSCNGGGGVDLILDWINDLDDTITETNIAPFPGMLLRPDYGAKARAAGLTVGAGDTGQVVRDRFPVWKGSIAPTDSITHDSAFVNGFGADDHMTMSAVYVQNNTGAAIDAMVGIGSDDAMQIILDGLPLAQFVICRGMGAANVVQDSAPALLPTGESRLLVKVTDGGGPSGFRLRFQDAVGDPILPPDITVSLQSIDDPPVVGTVVRAFSKTRFGGGESVDVSLVARTPTPVNMTIIESLPPGASATAISDNGILDAGAITWGLTAVTNKTVTYKIAAADPCGGVLNYPQSTYKVGAIEAVVTGPGTLKRTIEKDALQQWTSEDIATAGGGLEILSPNSVLVRGLGDQISGGQDQFHFVSVPRNGDWEITARIDCQEPSAPAASAGVMARTNADPWAGNIYLFATPEQGIRASKRRRTVPPPGVAQFSQNVALSGDLTFTYPVWLRMKRTGGNLSFSKSQDGAAFTEIGTHVIGTSLAQVDLPADVLLGLAVTSTNGSQSSLVQFSDVAGVPALPPFESGPPPPQPPTGLAAVAGSKKVDLTWTAPGGPAVNGYNVYQTKPGARTKLNAALITGTSFSALNLQDETEYCFVATSVGASESIDSSQACATTPKAGGGFKRGDVDANGAVEITDPINLLGFLFLGEAQPPCFDAADADDNGSLEITDAIVSLGFQFLGDPPPPAPGPTACGPDPTADPPGADFGCDYPPANCQ